MLLYQPAMVDFCKCYKALENMIFCTKEAYFTPKIVGNNGLWKVFPGSHYHNKWYTSMKLTGMSCEDMSLEHLGSSGSYVPGF